MTVGIGIIGAGVMGADHALTLSRSVAGAHLVAISDPDQGRARAAAEAAGAERVQADGFALIDDPSVDAVLVASPDPTHAPFVLACLERGKPVLCEKPLAPTAAGCRDVIEAETRLARRLVQVGFMRRFDPFYEDLRGVLAGGALGRLLMLHCVHRNQTGPAFFDATMAVNNSAVHEVDVIRWLTGEEIVAVQAVRSLSRRGSEHRDPLLLVLETAGGVAATVEVFIRAGYGYDIRMEAVCEEGTVDLARPEPPPVRRAGAVGSAFPEDWRGRFADAYRLELSAWVRSLQGGPPVGASAWDGFAATQVTDALVRSLESGARERVDIGAAPGLYQS